MYRLTTNPSIMMILIALFTTAALFLSGCGDNDEDHGDLTHADDDHLEGDEHAEGEQHVEGDEHAEGAHNARLIPVDGVGKNPVDAQQSAHVARITAIQTLHKQTQTEGGR